MLFVPLKRYTRYTFVNIYESEYENDEIFKEKREIYNTVTFFPNRTL